MRHKPSRRHVLCGAVALAGGAAVGSVRRELPLPVPVQPSPVSILRQTAYDQTLYSTVRRALDLHHLDVRGKHVVLKPNLVEFDPDRPINTHPLFVHAVLEGFRALGAASVRIAEGPGHRRATLDMADAAVYFDTIPGFESLFTDLNLDAVSLVHFARPHSKLTSLYLPQTVLGADLLVSLPKLKTHHWTGATLSMKNLFGVVPGGIYGWPKNYLHWAGIPECVADLTAHFPRTFALVDGIVGMEGNGPIQGVAKAAGVLVAGRDLPSVDATCCRIMGLDPQKIGYLQLSRASHALTEDFNPQRGETLGSVQTHFAVLPQFEALRLTAKSTVPIRT